MPLPGHDTPGSLGVLVGTHPGCSEEDAALHCFHVLEAGLVRASPTSTPVVGPDTVGRAMGMLSDTRLFCHASVATVMARRLCAHAAAAALVSQSTPEPTATSTAPHQRLVSVLARVMYDLGDTARRGKAFLRRALRETVRCGLEWPASLHPVVDKASASPMTPTGTASWLGAVVSVCRRAQWLDHARVVVWELLMHALGKRRGSGGACRCLCAELEAVSRAWPLVLGVTGPAATLGVLRLPWLRTVRGVVVRMCSRARTTAGQRNNHGDGAAATQQHPAGCDTLPVLAARCNWKVDPASVGDAASSLRSLLSVRAAALGALPKGVLTGVGDSAIGETAAAAAAAAAAVSSSVAALQAPDVAAAMASTARGVQLLCAEQGWKWTHEQVVVSSVWPLMDPAQPSLQQLSGILLLGTFVRLVNPRVRACVVLCPMMWTLTFSPVFSFFSLAACLVHTRRSAVSRFRGLG